MEFPETLGGHFDHITCHSCSLAFYGSDPNLCKKFYALKLWILESLNFSLPKRKFLQKNGLTNLKNQNKEQPTDPVEATLHHVRTPSLAPPTEVTAGIARTILQEKRISSDNIHPGISSVVFTHAESPSSPLEMIPSNLALGGKEGSGSSLSIAVIGATGELARGKIFPALFALYYSGFLPENVGIFGYSRKDLTDNDLRSIISSTLTYRIDHQKNCEDKLEAFLFRTYYLNGGFDNREGMSKLNLLMQSVEGASEVSQIQKHRERSGCTQAEERSLVTHCSEMNFSSVKPLQFRCSTRIFGRIRNSVNCYTIVCKEHLVLESCKNPRLTGIEMYSTLYILHQNVLNDKLRKFKDERVI